MEPCPHKTPRSLHSRHSFRALTSAGSTAILLFWRLLIPHCDGRQNLYLRSSFSQGRAIETSAIGAVEAPNKGTASSTMLKPQCRRRYDENAACPSRKEIKKVSPNPHPRIIQKLKVNVLNYYITIGKLMSHMKRRSIIHCQAAAITLRLSNTPLAATCKQTFIYLAPTYKCRLWVIFINYVVIYFIVC